MRPLGLKHTVESRRKIGESQRMRYEAIKEAMDANSRRNYFDDSSVNDSKLDKITKLRKQLYMSIGRASELLVQIATLKDDDEIKRKELPHPQPLGEGLRHVRLTENELHDVVLKSVQKIMSEKASNEDENS